MHRHNHWSPLGPAQRGTHQLFAVGERVRIIKAPESYGYNGRTGSIVSIEGAVINVMVDEHPSNVRCTTFYVEELEPEHPVS